ncbi:MAG: helix-turn-helix transcriptional regulator [Phycisphaerae bacterium]|nr:helix-turn-helix transcriptional regulator [Phycisphaerae bacterium]
MKKSKTLADLRTKAGLSQRDAAEKLSAELGRDIRQPHLARWESGAIEPRLSVVVAMAAVYPPRHGPSFNLECFFRAGAVPGYGWVPKKRFWSQKRAFTPYSGRSQWPHPAAPAGMTASNPKT